MLSVDEFLLYFPTCIHCNTRFIVSEFGDLACNNDQCNGFIIMVSHMNKTQIEFICWAGNDELQVCWYPVDDLIEIHQFKKKKFEIIIKAPNNNVMFKILKDPIKTIPKFLLLL